MPTVAGPAAAQGTRQPYLGDRPAHVSGGKLYAGFSKARLVPGSGTIGPIRVERVVQGTVIGSPSRDIHILTVEFVDSVRGFLSVQTRTCPGNGCAAALLHTTNGGGSWQRIYAGIAFIALSFISARLRFGVDAAGGLLETRDGGRHWSASPAPARNVSEVDYVDASHGWLLAGNLYRTENGGKRWTRLPFHCGSYQFIARLSVVDSKDGLLLCAAENGPFAVYLYRSRDGGASWAKVSTVDTLAHSLGAFDFLSTRMGFVGAGFGNLLRTTNGGRGFNPVPGTPFEGILAASWPNPRVGYVSTYGVLSRTGDAGSHWRQIYPATSPQGPISLTASGSGVGAATSWFPTAILQTHNGADWSQVARLPGASIVCLVRTSSRTVWAVVPATHGTEYDVQLFRSLDAGRRWRRALRVPGGTGFLSFVDSRLGFLSTTTPFRLYVTRDGGSTWSRRSESRRTWNDDFVSDTSGWAFGAGSNILHTSDGGRHWQPAAALITGLRPADVRFLDARHGWITGTRCDLGPPCTPVILRTRDGGVHWILIRLPRWFGIYGFDWVTPRLGYLTDGTVLYRTRDGGVTWRRVTP